jgi:hypothetical protein
MADDGCPDDGFFGNHGVACKCFGGGESAPQESWDALMERGRARLAAERKRLGADPPESEKITIARLNAESCRLRLLAEPGSPRSQIDFLRAAHWYETLLRDGRIFALSDLYRALAGAAGAAGAAGDLYAQLEPDWQASASGWRPHGHPSDSMGEPEFDRESGRPREVEHERRQLAALDAALAGGMPPAARAAAEKFAALLRDDIGRPPLRLVAGTNSFNPRVAAAAAASALAAPSAV